MGKPSLQVITLGCSKNTVDTSHLLACLQEDFSLLPEDAAPGNVDYLLLNTCGFIGDAKEESIQAILEAVERKKHSEAGKVIVFGCLSQRYADSLPGLIPEVDGWFGARDLLPLIKALGVNPKPGFETHRYISANPSYAFLKISEGCDRRCSYCAIPYIRGNHRSVPIEKLVEEATYLAAHGVRELVLIAQDTTFYGLDLYKKRSLALLLRRLSEIEGIEWIRIHYSYPADFPEDVLDEMVSNPKVCKYMDIPLQHVADPVLSAMHRGVDEAWTRALVKRMRERVPGIVLRTTMMVGHPGEKKAEFERLMDFVREARFERLGAFAYSEEEGTFGAANLKDSVPQKIKNQRLSALMEEQRGISFAYNISRVGSLEKVLVDAVADDGILVCRSEFESPEVDGEILVKPASGQVEDASQLVGKFLQVKIVSADEYDLTADFVAVIG